MVPNVYVGSMASHHIHELLGPEEDLKNVVINSAVESAIVRS